MLNMIKSSKKLCYYCVVKIWFVKKLELSSILFFELAPVGWSVTIMTPVQYVSK